MTIYSLINKTLTKFRGEEVKLDANIPIGYFTGFICVKVISLLWGMVRLRTTKRVFIHPSAIIKCVKKIHLKGNLNIERGCYIDALSINGLFLGSNVSFGYLTTLRITGSLNCIGNMVKIGNNVGLGTHGYYGCGVGTLEIGDNCIFGNYVSIHPENHNYSDIATPIRLQGVSSSGGVYIGDNCWIGAKVTILDGTKIGKGCIVAAGAVVKGEFPDNVVIGGIPARILKYRTR